MRLLDRRAGREQGRDDPQVVDRARCGREGGDAGKPIVDSDPTSPGATVLTEIASKLAGRGRGLAGMQLGLTPTSKF